MLELYVRTSTWMQYKKHQLLARREQGFQLTTENAIVIGLSIVAALALAAVIKGAIDHHTAKIN